MTIEGAKAYLREHWPNIRSQLLSGTYQPQPVQQTNAGLDSLAVALQRVRAFQNRNGSRADEPPSLPAVTARDSSTPNCGPALAVEPTFG